MRKPWLLAIAGTAGVLIAPAGLKPGMPAGALDLRAGLSSLVQSELDFSKAAAEQGIRKAFLAFLAEGSIVFRPRPVDGRKLYSESAESGGILAWYPVVADISSTGDFGYTTGPYEFRSGKTGDPVRHGNYASVWRRQPGGKWQVILDAGAPSPPPDSPPPAWTPPADFKPLFSPRARTVDPEAERRQLLETDRGFSARSKLDGVERAYSAYLADHARLLRQNLAPALGKPAIIARLAQRKEVWTWEPAAAVVAPGADLGFTHGVLAVSAGAGFLPGEGKYYYTRFWKRDAAGTWKVTLDVAQILPPPEGRR